MSVPGLTPPMNLQLAFDDRFTAAVGDFTPNNVNNFDPFAGRQEKAAGSGGVSIGAVTILGVGALALVASMYKGRR